MSQVQGSKAVPVYIVDDNELKENGGVFRVENGPATKVYGMDSEELSSLGVGVMGGNLEPVYVVSDAEAARRGVVQGHAMRISDAATNRKVIGRVAIPVYVVNLWPDPTEFISSTDAEVSNSGSITILHPPSSALNDLLIAQIAYDGGVVGEAATITAPVGWTTIYNEWEVGQGRLWIGWKNVTTPQPADFTWTLSSDGDAAGSIALYRCTDYNDPIDSVGTKGNGNSKNPKGNGPTTTRDYTKLLLFVAASGDPTLTPPTNWKKRTDIGGTSTSDKKNKGKGPVADATAVLSTTQTWQSVMIALAPCTTYPATVTVRLTWDDNADNENGYYVERSGDGVSFVQVASIAADSVTWDDENVETGQTLWYRVRAYNGDGNSGYSNTVSVGA